MNELQHQIIDEAREWLGTPFHHQGRLKGVGVDCVGLIIGVGRALNLQKDYIDEGDYSNIPDGSMEAKVNDVLIRIPRDYRQPGDIVHFAWTAIPQHLGILTDQNTVIHALGHDGHGKVVETHLAPAHLKRVRAVFRFPEVEQWQP